MRASHVVANDNTCTSLILMGNFICQPLSLLSSANFCSLSQSSFQIILLHYHICTFVYLICDVYILYSEATTCYTHCAICCARVSWVSTVAARWQMIICVSLFFSCAPLYAKRYHGFLIDSLSFSWSSFSLILVHSDLCTFVYFPFYDMCVSYIPKPPRAALTTTVQFSVTVPVCVGSLSILCMRP